VVKLATIQGIAIYTEKEKLEPIWFIQQQIRNIEYEKLEQRNFEISDILIQEGYKIPNPKQFDLALKNLFRFVVPEKFPHFKEYLESSEKTQNRPCSVFLFFYSLIIC